MRACLPRRRDTHRGHRRRAHAQTARRRGPRPRRRGDARLLGNPDATAATLAGGWLHTGDIGHLDAGYLYLTDRAKDVIITGGSNVYPREVEEVLLTHPAVREAAVVGVPDPEWGESVRAFVVAAGDPTPGELIQYCRGRVASFKKPREVILVELPKNAAGKILKRELRQLPPRRA